MLKSLTALPCKIIDALAGIAFVTVAVTCGTPRAAEQSYEVYLTNQRTGTTHAWAKRQWASHDACDKDLGNINEFLAAVADQRDAKLPDIAGAPDDLKQSVEAVVMMVLMNTGRAPDFRIGCRLTGPGAPV